MEIIIKENYQDMCKETAEQVISQLKKKPSSKVMLPSGETAKGLYKILVNKYEKGQISFTKASFFQLDDIIRSKKSESYSNYLKKRFLNKVNFKEENLHLFNSLSNNQKKDCKEYELAIRKKGIDLCVLGLGANGHIAFNEPGSKQNSKTRVTSLLKETQKVKSTTKTTAKKVFTIGISTIMFSKKILVIANGEKKAKAIKKSFNLNNFPKYPIAILNKHKDSTIITDTKGAILYNTKKVFKNYDIRGLIEEEITSDFAERLGQTIVNTTKSKNIIVGRDGRESGEKLLKSLILGIRKSGSNVLTLGKISTPVCYFTSQKYKLPGVIVTASHNPKAFNGFKIVKTDGLTVGMGSGLEKIKKAFEENNFVLKKRKTTIKKLDYFKDYKKHILSFAKDVKKVKIVVDNGNSSDEMLLDKILVNKKVKIYSISIPKKRIGNPLIDSNKELKAKIIKEKADFGVAYDFDGDRVFFFDETGKQIDNELIASLISKYLLTKNKNKGKILWDIRSDWIIKDVIKKNGGKPLVTRPGHSNIKTLMKKEKALYCGEISGHNYYKDNFYADSALITTIHVLSIFSNKNTKFSKLIKPFKKNFLTGEINFKIENRVGKIKEIEKGIKGGKRTKLDGLRVDFKNWWFCVRASNSQPVLRLTMGAKTKRLLKQKKKKITKIISS